MPGMVEYAMKEMLKRNSGRQGLFVVVSPFGRGRLEKLMAPHGSAVMVQQGPESEAQYSSGGRAGPPIQPHIEILQL